MILHPSINEIYKRREVLEKALRSGTMDSRVLTENYCYVYKDGDQPILGHGRSGSYLGNESNDDYSTFIVTTLGEDRDGDIVVPMGWNGENYKNNPIWFFGHQDWEIAIGTSKSPDGRICCFPEENRMLQRLYWDTHDEDAMFLKGKYDRGIMNATSIAFVPIRAYKRDDIHKAHPSDQSPVGHVFEEWDHTETSLVGIGANPGAVRDMVDQEKSFIRPRLQKALRAYAAKSKREQGICWTGWCPQPDGSCKPCEKSATTKTTPKKSLARKSMPTNKLRPVKRAKALTAGKCPVCKHVWDIDDKDSVRTTEECPYCYTRIRDIEKGLNESSGTAGGYVVEDEHKGALDQKQITQKITEAYNFGKETGQTGRAIKMIEDLVMSNDMPEWLRSHATKAVAALSRMKSAKRYSRGQVMSTKSKSCSCQSCKSGGVCGCGKSAVRRKSAPSIQELRNWSTAKLESFSNPASPAWNAAQNDDKLWDALQAALDMLKQRQGKSLRRKSFKPGDKVVVWEPNGNDIATDGTVVSSSGGWVEVREDNGRVDEWQESRIELQSTAYGKSLRRKAFAVKNERGQYLTKRSTWTTSANKAAKYVTRQLAQRVGSKLKGYVGVVEMKRAGGRVVGKQITKGQTFEVNGIEHGIDDALESFMQSGMDRTSLAAVRAWMGRAKPGDKYNYAQYGIEVVCTKSLRTKSIDTEYDQGYVAAYDGRARNTNPYRTDTDPKGRNMKDDWDAGWVDGAKDRIAGRSPDAGADLMRRGKSTRKTTARVQKAKKRPSELKVGDILHANLQGGLPESRVVSSPVKYERRVEVVVEYLDSGKRETIQFANHADSWVRVKFTKSNRKGIRKDSPSADAGADLMHSRKLLKGADMAKKSTRKQPVKRRNTTMRKGVPSAKVRQILMDAKADKIALAQLSSPLSRVSSSEEAARLLLQYQDRVDAYDAKLGFDEYFGTLDKSLRRKTKKELAEEEEKDEQELLDAEAAEAAAELDEEAVETKDDEELEDEEKEEEEGLPPPHADTMAKLYDHLKSASEYVEMALGGMTNFDPETGEPNKAKKALQDHHDRYITSALEKIKGLFEQFAPDQDLEKMCKALNDEYEKMETDGGSGTAMPIGEDNLVDRGYIPDEVEMEEDEAVEFEDDADVLKSLDDQLTDEEKASGDFLKVEERRENGGLKWYITTTSGKVVEGPFDDRIDARFRKQQLEDSGADYSKSNGDDDYLDDGIEKANCPTCGYEDLPSGAECPKCGAIMKAEIGSDEWVEQEATEPEHQMAVGDEEVEKEDDDTNEIIERYEQTGEETEEKASGERPSKQEVRDALRSMPSNEIENIYFRFMASPASGRDQPSTVYANGLANAYDSGKIRNVSDFLSIVGDYSKSLRTTKKPSSLSPAFVKALNDRLRKVAVKVGLN